MAGMARNLCRIDADTDVKREILACSDKVRHQIGEFLESLQQDPLPAQRRPKDEGAFYIQLSCGVFILWEVVGDLLHLVYHGPDESILVRILAVGWESPAAP